MLYFFSSKAYKSEIVVGIGFYEINIKNFLIVLIEYSIPSFSPLKVALIVSESESFSINRCVID